MDKRETGLKPYERILVLVTALITGLSLRLYFALTLSSVSDGGTFLYWANLINNGAIPYRNFFIRDPLYIYSVALSTRTLGSSFFSISLVSIIPSIATVPILYYIVREISDYASGLVAAVTYSVAPTVIWYSTVFDERSLMLFLSSCAMLMLIKGLKTQRLLFLALFGLILGLGTFAYRGIAIYIVTVPFLFAYLSTPKDLAHARRFLQYALTSVVCYALAAGLILALFGAFSSLSWMVSSFGFSGQAESAGWFIWGQTSDYSFKERILHVAVREWLYLVIPAGAFLLGVIWTKLSHWRNIFAGLAIALVVSFLLGSVIGSTNFPQTSYGAYEPSGEYEIAFLIFLLVMTAASAVTFRSVARGISHIRKMNFGYSVAVFWFVSTVVLILLFGVPLVNYYYYFAPPLTVMASPIIRTLAGLARPPGQSFVRSVIKNPRGIVVLAILLANATVTTGMLLNSEMTWRNQSSSTVYRIASYVESTTNASEEILSGNPAIALFANRTEILGIVLLQMYGRTGPEPFDPLPNDPFHLFPNVAQISEEMNSGNVRYVVGDSLVLGIMALHPMWEQSFKTNFVVETTIDGIPIYSFK